VTYRSFVRRQKISIALLLILLLPAVLRAQATPPPLSSYNWAVDAAPNLVSHPPPLAAIRAFMVKIMGRDDERESDVCEFRFVNLRRSGNLSLIVTLADSGRGGCCCRRCKTDPRSPIEN
jgi:hypothetical protein